MDIMTAGSLVNGSKANPHYQETGGSTAAQQLVLGAGSGEQLASSCQTKKR